MPRYKFTYAVETPLRTAEDVTFTHGNFPVELGFSRPIDAEHIPASTVAEGANWWEANAMAMEDGFGPVLDALSLHRKAPTMVQDLQSVVKAETGTLRRAIVIESHKETHPVPIDGLTVREVQSALDAGTVSRPALRWLRYSYRAIPVLERFVFAWLAYENRCGATRGARPCPHCQKDLPMFPSVDRDEAFRILAAREPELARPAFDTIVSCINNAIVQRKEMDNSDWAMHPRSFFCDFRIPSMEPRMSSINSSTSFGQLLANSRLANDQTPSSGFSCGA